MNACDLRGNVNREKRKRKGADSMYIYTMIKSQINQINPSHYEIAMNRGSAMRAFRKKANRIKNG